MMVDPNARGISYTAGFFILIGFTVAGLLLAGLITIPVWTTLTGLPFEKFDEGLSDPANSDAVKLVQCINAVFAFLLPALLTASLMNRKPVRLLGFSSKPQFRQGVLVLGIMMAALFVAVSLSWFNERIPITEAMRLQFEKAEQDYQRQIVAILGLNNPGEFILAIVIMGFVPAFCEETLFRGGLQNFLARATKSPWLSIVIVSILFSLAHLSFYGFLSRFFLGIVLGLIFQYTGKLWLCIIAHFLNNALAVTILYIYKLKGIPISEAVDENVGSYWGIVLLPIVILLLVWLKKVSPRVQETVPAQGDNLFHTPSSN